MPYYKEKSNMEKLKHEIIIEVYENMDEFNIEVYENMDEFNENEKRLIAEAVNASNNAYAKYSNFKVGSAVLLSNDEIISGSNQENAVFQLGLCAERVALFTESNKYPEELS